MHGSHSLYISVKGVGGKLADYLVTAPHNCMFVLYFFKLKPILIFNFLILYTILEPT
jgi:hypothetical protein